MTYKFLKPDAFFVTAGEEGDNKFYRRYAVGEGGKLRGFAFLYPKSRAKALDPVSLAIANSFDPFPSAPLPPVASPTPTPSPTPEAPKLTATALVVAPGVAVTTLEPGQCKAPTVAGKPARFLEGRGPLARLGGEFGANAAPIPQGEPAGELVALSCGRVAALARSDRRAKRRRRGQGDRGAGAGGVGRAAVRPAGAARRLRRAGGGGAEARRRGAGGAARHRARLGAGRNRRRRRGRASLPPRRSQSLGARLLLAYSALHEPRARAYSYSIPALAA